MFVAGWRHALRSEWPFIIIIITNMNMRNISDYGNQETIAQILWNIRMTRIKLGVEVDVVLMWFHFLSRICV